MQAWRRNLVAGLCGGCLAGAAVYVYLQDAAPSGVIDLNPHGFAAAYLVPSDEAQTTITAYVPYSEMDNTGTLGLAHYVEHLAWENAFGAAPDMDRHSNAYTTTDHIAYFVSVPREDLVQNVQTLAKIAQPLNVDAEFARQEIGIIAREYDFAVAENPYHDIFEQFYIRHYGNDARARSIIGTPQTIAAFTYEEAKAWHAATHQRSAVTVVISGQHSKSEAEQALSTVLDTPSPTADPLLARAQIDLAARMGGIREIASNQLAQPQLFWGRLAAHPGGVSAIEAQAQIDLLFTLLGSTLEGSMAGPLRFDARIAQAYDFALYLAAPFQASMTLTSARPDAGVTLQDLARAIDETLAAIAEQGVPEATLARIQTRMLRDLDEQDPADLAAVFIADAAGQRRAPFDAAQYRAALQAAKAQDLTIWLRALAQSPSVVDLIIPNN
jgi:predicted Zn-dependent peptidase